MDETASGSELRKLFPNELMVSVAAFRPDLSTMSILEFQVLLLRKDQKRV